MARLATCGVLVMLEGIAHAVSLSSEVTQGALVGGLFLTVVSLLPSINSLADSVFKMLTAGSGSDLPV